MHHQKEKHLRCPTCHKRMVSTSGLVVHALQVHKRTVTSVPNAIEGRDNPKIDVFGMRGIPDDNDSKNQSFKRHKNGDTANAVAASAGMIPGVVSAVPDVPPPSIVPQYSMYPPTAPHVPLVPASYPHVVNAHQSSLPSHTASFPQHVPFPYPYPAAVPYTHHAYGYGPRSHFPAPPPRASVRNPHPSSRPLRDRPVINPMPNAPRLDSATVPPTVKEGSLPGLPNGASQQDSTARPTMESSPRTKSNTKQITVVFDRDDVCMEELRAQLPRYRTPLKEPLSVSCGSAAAENVSLTSTATVSGKGE